MNAPAAFAAPGQPILVQFTQSITEDDGRYGRTGIYLSADAMCTTDDTLIGSSEGHSWHEYTWGTIPETTPLGSGFLCVITDDLSEVPESNEDDNTASAPIEIVSATLNLKVNGLDPSAPFVTTDGSVNLTLTIPPIAVTADVHFYWVIDHVGARLGLTPQGWAPLGVPYYSGPPFVVTDLLVLTGTLPPGGTVTFHMYLAYPGGEVIASDIITATRP